MPNYLLSVYQPEGTPPSKDELDAIMKNVRANQDEMKAAGVWVFSGGLAGQETATVVRDGGALLTDGPFAEAKEYLGGLTIIDAPDLDAALEWGRKAAAATTLPIEVRPFFWS
ncbi:YciI family protein [Pseudonocardia ailaonensis]|uniref:YciI family protein n=1 Tax=Pseudonocardia ailaonensis TaxID=367279 RepID=A0ABN2NKR8_9PSEU